MNQNQTKTILCNMLVDSITTKLFCNMVNNVYELSKEDVKKLISKIHYYDKYNAKNNQWLKDRKIVIDFINSYCEMYRCYSLIQK